MLPMRTSTRGVVLHVDLSGRSAVPDLQVNAPFCRVVLWWDDCPIGQLDDVGAVSRILDLAVLSETVPPDIRDGALKIVSDRLPERKPATTSIVICTRDRPDFLARCLASIRHQTLSPNQVIVVDNASKLANTREVALAAGVDYVREERPGLDFARNAGARAAIGEIVAYTDDDVQLHSRWLERLVSAFDTPEVMAVTGLVLPAELETEAQLHFETYWGFGRGYRRIDFGSIFFASDQTRGCPVWEIGAGANMAFRRGAFEKVGFFDERLDVGAAGCSGDSEFWHRVLAHGGVCRYEPSAVAYHFHRRDWAGLSDQIFYYMRGHAASLLIQFERSGNVGNLRRALLTIPLMYAQRTVRHLVKKPVESDRLLGREIAGYFSGLFFYLHHSKFAQKLVSK
jgi:glycosyltransferase involved in cell wall biosynthesis